MATGVTAIIEGKNDKIIYRNESGDRRSERFRNGDPGCHGPTIAKRISARSAQNRSLRISLNSVKARDRVKQIYGALRSRLASGRGEALRPSFLLFFLSTILRASH